MLARRLGRGREVHEHLGAIDGLGQRRGEGHPHILADLDAHGGVVAQPEQQVAPEGDLLSAKAAGRELRVGARAEVAGFVKLRVVGDEGLGHHAPDRPAADDHGAVVERGPQRDGHPDDGRQRKVGRAAQQIREGLLRGPQQPRLQEQVAAGVARERKLGKDHQRGAPLRGPPDQLDGPPGVPAAVGDPHMRHGGRHLQITESVHNAQSMPFSPTVGRG